MTDSILVTIKNMLGVETEDTSFDTDITVHINSALMAANQFGVGPEGFLITGDTQTWQDLLGEAKNLEGIKTYIYLKVKLLFDPPASQTVVDAYTNQIAEFAYRLALVADPPVVPVPTPTEEGGVI